LVGDDALSKSGQFIKTSLIRNTVQKNKTLRHNYFEDEEHVLHHFSYTILAWLQKSTGKAAKDRKQK
jgi:hypothetical protein